MDDLSPILSYRVSVWAGGRRSPSPREHNVVTIRPEIDDDALEELRQAIRPFCGTSLLASSHSLPQVEGNGPNGQTSNTMVFAGVGRCGDMCTFRIWLHFRLYMVDFFSIQAHGSHSSIANMMLNFEWLEMGDKISSSILTSSFVCACQPVAPHFMRTPRS